MNQETTEPLSFRAELLADIDHEYEESDIHNRRFKAEIFLDKALTILRDANITFDYELARFEGTHNRKKAAIDAYSILYPSEDTGEAAEVHLFAGIYSGSLEAEAMGWSDTMQTRFAQALHFFNSARVSNSFVDKQSFPDAALLADELYELNRSNTPIELRIFIVSDRPSAARRPATRDADGVPLTIEIVDIQRLENHAGGGPLDNDILLDFPNGGLPVVYVPSSDAEAGYDYALAALPASSLVDLFHMYKERVLESNVRSFLGGRGRVNKELITTAKSEPELFMAYNNGVVILAKDVAIGGEDVGNSRLLQVHSPQIVNGGQTTVSLYMAAKNQKNHKESASFLSKIFIPAKIIVPRTSVREEQIHLVGNIAKYSNTQNTIKTSDLSSSHDFHVNFEKVAARTFLNDGKSTWFYERSAGSYNAYLETNSKDSADRRKRAKDKPKARVLKKHELVKALLCWNEPQLPHIAARGNEKSIPVFMGRIDKECRDAIQAKGITHEQFYDELVDREFVQNAIAAHIVLRDATRWTKRQQWGGSPGVIAQYSVAYCATLVPMTILKDVWRNQAMTRKLETTFAENAPHVNKAIRDIVGTGNLTEFTKKEGSFDRVVARVKELKRIG